MISFLDQNIIRVRFKSDEVMKCISLLLPYFGILGMIYEESCTVEISHKFVRTRQLVVAQLVEQSLPKLEICGSKPAINNFFYYQHY